MEQTVATDQKLSKVVEMCPTFLKSYRVDKSNDPKWIKLTINLKEHRIDLKSIQKGVIQGERNGKVSVKMVEAKRIINVNVHSVFRKEPESGSNVIYFDPEVMNSEDYENCLSIEKGEAVTKLASGALKLIPLKDVVPYCSDEIA